jgi:hypothetical protein
MKITIQNNFVNGIFNYYEARGVYYQRVINENTNQAEWVQYDKIEIKIDDVTK